MREIINYMMEANLALLLFLAFYKLLLARETNFRFQRVFMLGAVVISVVAPFLHLGNSPFVNTAAGNAAPVQLLPPVVVERIASKSAGSEWYDVWNITGIVYVMVVLFLLALLVRRMTALVIRMRNEKHYRHGRYRIIESAENKPAFSFFHFIYIGNAQKLTASEKQKIILHESAHASQFHSFDNLLVQITGIFFWFNPFVNNYKKIFVQLHEFEADARTATGDEVNAYCSLLAKVALRSVEFPFANHFNQSLTLKRIEMMRTIKKRTSSWKFVAAAAVVAGCFVFIACQDQVNNSPMPVSAEAQESPLPEGGMEKFYTYLKRNLRYPKDAREKSIQGKVLVEFLVKEDGSVSEIKALASPDPVLAEEAKRLVAAGPKWVPGKQKGSIVEQRMVLPIVFKLEGVVNTSTEALTPDGALKEVVAVGYAPKNK